MSLFDKPHLWIAVTVLTLFLPGFSFAEEKLNVVTTTSDLAAIARIVGGDKAEVMSLATGKEDPHHIAAKPSYMMAVRKADLWIRTGMELEIGYEPLILDGSRNTRIRIGTRGHLDASTGVIRLEVPTQKIDRSMGDIHPQGNPHYMLDPLNGRIVAKTIAARMAELKPEHASYFNERLKAFRLELDKRMFGPELVEKIGGGKLWALVLKGKLDQVLKQPGMPVLGGWLGTMRPHAGTKVIPYHRNWSYFFHRFGLVVPIEVEPKPGIPPSTVHLSRVLQQVKQTPPRAILRAAYQDPKAADWLHDRSGIPVIELPYTVGGNDAATDLFKLFDVTLQLLEGAT